MSNEEALNFIFLYFSEIKYAAVLPALQFLASLIEFIKNNINNNNERKLPKADIKQTLALELCKEPTLSDTAKEYLSEHLERVAFQKYYGINTNTTMRHALFQFYSIHQDHINWTNIKRAYPNISLQNTCIIFKIGISDYFLNFIHYVTSMFSYFYFFLLFQLYWKNQESLTTLQSFIVLIIITIFFALIFTILIMIHSHPYYNIKKIIARLKNNPHAKIDYSFLNLKQELSYNLPMTYKSLTIKENLTEKILY